jgi:putative endonuclease
MNKNSYYGKLGESIAKNYLINNGHLIVASNFRLNYDEIDIITKHNQYLVFIEVKTRLSNKYGKAEDQLTLKKARKLHRSINKFLAIHGYLETKVRADFIAINLNIGKKMANIKHYKNIF